MDNSVCTVEKRPYQAPVLTHHGRAVEKTRGGAIAGYSEGWGWKRIQIP